MKNLLIASTSTVHGGEYLDYLLPTLENHFASCNTILFIPYARPSGISHDEYTEKVSVAFAKINKKVKGLHEFENLRKLLKMRKEFLLVAVTHLYWSHNYMRTK